MKKIVLAMLLVATVTAVAQTTSAPAQPQQNPAQPAAPASQKKEIKDPAEYNAYIGAVNQTDPAAKVSAFEAFLTQYPNSVMKEDALELLMGAYQQTNNQAKTIETAQKVLAANPCNLRALALLAFTKRALAEGGQPQQLAEGGQFAEKGLQCVQSAPKPEGTKDEDFQKLKTQVSAIFNFPAVVIVALVSAKPRLRNSARANTPSSTTAKTAGMNWSLRRQHPRCLHPTYWPKSWSTCRRRRRNKLLTW